MAHIKSTILVLVLLPVVFVICLPILLGSMLTVIVLTFPFVVLGLDPHIQGYAALIVGFGGGLVLCFVTLVFVYRHLPARIRWILSVDPAAEPPGSRSVIGGKPDSEPATFSHRIRGLDATIVDPDPDPDPDADADAAAAEGRLERD